jgi:hypothetical protein
MLGTEFVVEIAENGTQTLECPVEGIGPADEHSMEFEWTKNGIPLSSTTHSLIQVKYQLFFKN